MLTGGGGRKSHNLWLINHEILRRDLKQIEDSVFIYYFKHEVDILMSRFTCTLSFYFIISFLSINCVFVVWTVQRTWKRNFIAKTN